MKEKRIFILLVIGFMTISILTRASFAIEIKGLVWTPKDALLYSDLVVEGVIDTYTTERVPVQEFAPADPRKGVTFPIINLHLKILDVLRGNFDSPTLVAVIPGGYPGRGGGLEGRTYNYAKGDTTILTLYYRRAMKGGSYVAGTDKGRFILKNGIWENQDSMHRFPPRTLQEIKSIIAVESIQNVASKADLIILGTIEQVKIVEEKQPSGVIGRIHNVFVKIDKIYKGTGPSSKEITFRMIRKGLYNPKWRKPVPEVKPGEQWLLFLKRGEPGLYPFAGSNGMFKVDGERLIYNNRVTYKHKKGELERIIRQEVRTK